MNRAHLTHGIWLLVTMGMFVAGSQWARPSKTAADSEPPDQQAVVRRGLPEVTPTKAAGRVEEKTPKVEDDGNAEEPERRDFWKGRDMESVFAFAAAIPSRVESPLPLNGKQIEALVLTAIKSRDPVERRTAFDRILEEMRSDSFSAQQAHTIRRVMHENGANGELWRLFDYAWGANDPTAALANLESIPEQYYLGYLGNMIPGLASTHPALAIELFEGLDNKTQSTIRKRFFEGLIDNGTSVATEYLYAVTDPESYYWRPMDELTREHIKDKGLEPTLQWMDTLPEGPLRTSAWSAAYAHWTSREPEQAVDAILQMEPSHDRNAAINGFVSAHAGEDGEAAVIWAAEISEPGMRSSALVRVGQKYYQQDAQAAAQWFESNRSLLPEGGWAQIVGAEDARE